MNLLNIFYLFVIYSFLGWIIETTFVSIRRNKFVNMGFLDGPFSPIYGSGALAIILFVFPFRHNLLLFFIMSIIITTIIEYITSFIFERAFNIIFWDYSKRPFNIHGRVCLQYSLYWGVLSMIILTFLHPSIIPISQFLSHYLGFFGVAIFAVYFIIDATDTLSDLLRFKNIITQKISHNLNFQLSNKIRRLVNSFPNLTSKINKDFISEIKSKLKIKSI